MGDVASVIGNMAKAEADPLWMDLVGVVLFSLAALTVATVGVRILLGVWGVW